MKLTKEIYLNCGVYDNHGTDILFIAVPGFFASSTWCKSDEAYDNTLGRKFEGITSDDNKSWLLERLSIRRLTEDDNIEELLNNSCNDFIDLFNDKFINKNHENN